MLEEMTGEEDQNEEGGQNGEAPSSPESAFFTMDTNGDDVIGIDEWMSFSDMDAFEPQGEPAQAHQGGNNGGDDQAPPQNEDGSASPQNDGNGSPHNKGGQEDETPPAYEDAFYMMDTNFDDVIDFSEWMAFADIGAFEP